ncbi:MAG: PIN domain-containing protein [Candidatus Heimdallarchaeota archaeon]
MTPTVIVLDTNFLLSCLDFQVDIISELERLFPGLNRLVVASEVVVELEKLATTQKAMLPRIRLALDFIRSYCEIIPPSQAAEVSKSKVDDVILSLTQKLHGVIATNDQALRKKSRANGIASVFLRERAYLAVDGI